MNLTVSREGAIAIVTLNRPERRNALSLDLMRELLSCLEEIGRESEIRSVILAAAGTVFWSGHDLGEMTGRDLKQYNFDDRMGMMASSSAMVTTVTQPMHFSASSGEGAFDAQRMANFEITPEGNGITLEDEMMKVTTNMMDYQAATSLYQKSIRILRVAMGKNA